jgi:hypothetical protein
MTEREPEKLDPKVLSLKPKRERPEDVGVTVRINIEQLVEPPSAPVRRSPAHPPPRRRRKPSSETDS